jgi:uncharacterized protein YjeT (DUF2065 family)
MGDLLLVALGLVLLIEGILPFTNPQAFRKVLQAGLQSSDATLRNIGLISMILGLILLYGAG